MDRGAWWATVQGVAKTWTRLIFTFFHYVKDKKDHSASPGEQRRRAAGVHVVTGHSSTTIT